jgi:hypothetical protein
MKTKAGSEDHKNKGKIPKAKAEFLMRKQRQTEKNKGRYWSFLKF